MATVYRCAMRATLQDGTVSVTVPHVEDETDGTAADVASNFAGHIATSWIDLYATTATVNEITVTQVPTDSTPLPHPKQAIADFSTAGTASLADNALSPAVCAVAQLLTGVAGRRARGRMFMPPAIASDQVVDVGQFDPAGGKYLDRCNTFLTNLTGSYGGGIQLVVYSKRAASLSAALVWFHVIGFELPNRQHWHESRQFPAP